MSITSVLIADANLLMRRGIHALLEDQQSVTVVAEADSPATLLALAQEYHPQVITIDCAQQDGFNLQDIISLKATCPGSNLLVITSQPDKETILEALRCGVCGYVLKNSSEQEILAALHATSKGERYMCSKVLDVILAQAGAVPETRPETSIALSARETEIIQLIAEGKSTAEIAQQLFLSPHTINSHRKSILRKLQIKSPAELIVKALDLGIVKLK
ncbi:response regulator transcription factor [Pontibacter sp. SGAir0037]|uniref:LuxR C-terminal-related transcriptional regulator n=1 Tax=Pontibacter sp. SGAir0037 TaxID=2571030 RepID=UPI0010CD05C7|nr:response regulator transcription factor [Pontibacter sp. SGAir0037]QCR21136.1 hypothetical protein C1N53_01365 [Pontibacter sp. SGAir0037]